MNSIQDGSHDPLSWYSPPWVWAKISNLLLNNSTRQKWRGIIFELGYKTLWHLPYLLSCFLCWEPAATMWAALWRGPCRREPRETSGRQPPRHWSLLSSRFSVTVSESAWRRILPEHGFEKTPAPTPDCSLWRTPSSVSLFPDMQKMRNAECLFFSVTTFWG